ncbi:MAG: InlB B-repeat-containing protein, partial [Muribaculaceae bacterium]|nr:InlB B-repeat-containing protein [Muribaculaceae bacterium]
DTAAPDEGAEEETPAQRPAKAPAKAAAVAADDGIALTAETGGTTYTLTAGGTVDSLHFTVGAKMEVKSKNYTIEGENFSKYFDPGGKTQSGNAGRYIIIKLNNPATIKVWNANSGNTVLAESADSVTATKKATKTSSDRIDTFDVTEGGTYYLAFSSKAYICQVQIVEAGTGSTHTHNWSTAWTRDANYHWHNCTADGCTVTDNSKKDGYAAHSWGNETVTKQPDCKTGTAGEATYSCTDGCGATTTKEIPASHSWNNGTCANCGAEQPTFTNQGGWMESAYAEWSLANVAQGTTYTAFVAPAGTTNWTQLDSQLIREYPSYMRVDALGLAAGSYQIKVVGSDGVEMISDALSVTAHDRSGYGFVGGTPGAYNTDGTLKSGAKIYYVTNTTELTSAVKQSSPAVIRVLGKVESTGITLKSNVTIEGVGNDGTLYGGGIKLTNGTGEVRNLGIMWSATGSYEDCVTIEGGKNYWIHNCDFFYGQANDTENDKQKGDGALDIKKSNYVTVSYNHFWDNGKTSLLGGDTTQVQDYLTYHHNWFDHTDSRNPRIRNAKHLHIYNNYYDSNSEYGVGAVYQSNAFVESNYFRDCAYPMLMAGQGSDVAGKNTFFPGNNNDDYSKPGESGGVIKAYGNMLAGDYTFVPYHAETASTEFDAYVVTDRNATVPNTVTNKLDSATTYSNFDTASDMYAYTAQTAEAAMATTTQYAGRLQGGDLKYDLEGMTKVDDSQYPGHVLPDAGLKALIVDYQSDLVSTGGTVTQNHTETIGCANGDHEWGNWHIAGTAARAAGTITEVQTCLRCGATGNTRTLSLTNVQADSVGATAATGGSTKPEPTPTDCDCATTPHLATKTVEIKDGETHYFKYEQGKKIYLKNTDVNDANIWKSASSDDTNLKADSRVSSGDNTAFKFVMNKPGTYTITLTIDGVAAHVVTIVLVAESDHVHVWAESIDGVATEKNTDWASTGWLITKRASCTEAGEMVRVCISTEGCDLESKNYRETATIKAAGHTWGAWTVTTPATCQQAGQQTHTCTVEGCGASESEAIPVAAHVDANGDGLCDYGCGTEVVPTACCSELKPHKASEYNTFDLSLCDGETHYIEMLSSGSNVKFYFNEASNADYTYARNHWSISGASGVFGSTSNDTSNKGISSSLQKNKSGTVTITNSNTNRSLTLVVVDLSTIEVTVTYQDVDGTVIGEPTTEVGRLGQKLTEPAAPTAPEGKAFAGWYVVENGEVTSKKWDFANDVVSDKEITLRAAYGTQYVVHYYLIEDGQETAKSVPGLEDTVAFYAGDIDETTVISVAAPAVLGYIPQQTSYELKLAESKVLFIYYTKAYETHTHRLIPAAGTGMMWGEIVIPGTSGATLELVGNDEALGLTAAVNNTMGLTVQGSALVAADSVTGDTAASTVYVKATTADGQVSYYYLTVEPPTTATVTYKLVDGDSTKVASTAQPFTAIEGWDASKLPAGAVVSEDGMSITVSSYVGAPLPVIPAFGDYPTGYPYSVGQTDGLKESGKSFAGWNIASSKGGSVLIDGEKYHNTSKDNKNQNLPKEEYEAGKAIINSASVTLESGWRNYKSYLNVLAFDVEGKDRLQELEISMKRMRETEDYGFASNLIQLEVAAGVTYDAWQVEFLYDSTPSVDIDMVIGDSQYTLLGMYFPNKKTESTKEVSIELQEGTGVWQLAKIPTSNAGQGETAADAPAVNLVLTEAYTVKYVIPAAAGVTMANDTKTYIPGEQRLPSTGVLDSDEKYELDSTGTRRKVENKNVEFAEQIKLAALPELKNDPTHILNGWYVKNDQGEDVYYGGEGALLGLTGSMKALDPNGDHVIELYATYDKLGKDYTVKYDRNLPAGVDGTGVAQPATTTQNTASGFATFLVYNEELVLEGWEFKGWSKDDPTPATLEGLYQPEANLMVEDPNPETAEPVPEVTLYAIWERLSHTVSGTIDNGGTVTNNDQTVAHGEQSLAMVFTPAEGYRITGVTVNGTAVAEPAIADDGSYTYAATQVTEDTLVEVTTEKKVYTVTGIIGNGTVNGKETKFTQTVVHGEQSEPMVFTAAPGYEITGVKITGPNGNYTKYPQLTYTYPAKEVTQDITVEVTTAQKQYYLAFRMADDNLNKAEFIAPEGLVEAPNSTYDYRYEFDYNTPDIQVQNPDRPGYVFTGWSTGNYKSTLQGDTTSAGGLANVVVPTHYTFSKADANTLVLTAGWQADTFTFAYQWTWPEAGPVAGGDAVTTLYGESGKVETIQKPINVKTATGTLRQEVKYAPSTTLNVLQGEDSYPLPGSQYYAKDNNGSVTGVYTFSGWTAYNEKGEVLADAYQPDAETGSFTMAP